MDIFKKALRVVVKLGILLLWVSNILCILWFVKAPAHEELVVRGKATIIHLIIALILVKILDLLGDLVKGKSTKPVKEEIEHG